MAEEFDAVPVEAPTVQIKVFGKWSPDEVHVNDISLSVSYWLFDLWGFTYAYGIRVPKTNNPLP